MALTKIKTGGIQDDAITQPKIAAGSVGTTELASSAVGAGNLQTASVETAKIQDQAVTLDKLPHGTSSNDGKFLRANNGADPSFETVSIPAGTTINNNADNRVITGSGTANTLNGESNVQINSSGIMTIGNDASGAATLGGDLNVANTDGGTIVVGDTGSGEYLKLHGSGSGAKVGSKSNHPLIFFTNDTGNERMRLDTSGRLGIGTDTPTAPLHVYKAAHYVVTDSGKASGGIHVRGANGNAGEYGGAISFSCGDGDSSAAIAARQGGSDPDYTGMSFFTHPGGVMADDAVEKVRIHHSGEASFTDGICLGNQLTLSADNTLDDYEEGEWNPGGSWTTIDARYIKVGRTVYAGFSLRANTTGSANVQITNLPFTAANNKGSQGGIAWGLCEHNSTGGWIHGFVDENTTNGIIKKNNAENLTFGSGSNNMNNQAFIRGTFIYLSAT